MGVMSVHMGKKVQVVVVAEKPQRQVLLLQTNERRGCFWQNVTGSVEEGESFEDAAARELQEETQFKSVREIVALDLTFQFYHEGREIHYTERCFIALTASASPPTLDPKEHRDFTWLPIQEVALPRYGHASNFEAYEEAIQYLRSH